MTSAVMNEITGKVLVFLSAVERKTMDKLSRCQFISSNFYPCASEFSCHPLLSSDSNKSKLSLKLTLVIQQNKIKEGQKLVSKVHPGDNFDIFGDHLCVSSKVQISRMLHTCLAAARASKAASESGAIRL